MSHDPKVNVTFQLEGEDARLFLAYKADQYLKNTAEAARKLMLERLHEIERQKTEPATVAA